ncbi:MULTISPECIES: hydantoinase B/oxoprolinase family protein [unclassified Achromobacter]|uniref:hydantoinase B/oxoprolinase family protein n=1 Tax=unclassified Achromobacter TaxID=2626865 RepID=UPI000B51AA56|nr:MULTISPECIES: hydantoinase B/oxoprolinase family protein [unclassified Achromobacter]OWT71447.1 5-oxoprolinase [Achromobacter sp. HZ34]OWT73104.1 5-oxoprolinase [Achromobacter sp. HZ28]
MNAIHDTHDKQAFDPIAVEVFTNRLLAITESMASNIMRASFSPQIKERRDFSVGMFDRQGRLIAQGTHIPVHLGSLMGSVEAVLARWPLAEIRDGDVYVCNDPYAAGGTHLPDISVITPVFVDGRLVAFAANIGHHSDVGGAVPGSTSAAARTIYEEGLRIPIMRVARGRQVDDDLIGLIALNSRLPEERSLDLRVQIATNEKGLGAIGSLIDRMGGAAKFEKAVDGVLAYTLQRARHRVAALPARRSTFTTWLDDDGSGQGGRVPLTATVYKDGAVLVVDLEGSGPQSRGALNVSDSALRATVYYCVKAMLDPDLMANSGMAGAIVIKAPSGSIVNPRSPGACGARTITCQRLAGAIIGAFVGLVDRERAIASSVDTMPTIAFSGTRPEDGSIYLSGETLGGGGGARDAADGMDGIHVHITNSRNLPTEILEHECPLRVEHYGFAVDSAGPGRHRGGLGIVREVRMLRDETIFSARSDSHLQGAAGAEGGGEGGRGRLLRNAGSSAEEVLGSKVRHLILARGETVRIETPGGAGFGDPAARPLEALAEDLRDGLVTEAYARRFYGDALTDGALQAGGRAG